ncbi:MAG: DUF167 domain-containing protein [Gammaproteobacteria bacterium]|jgi:hypothetical protein|nr:DUF167 domain-containing protein [Gammaproteobacteria bacterium]MCW8942193.1 DUF167 domain-containing protein [Gammaproteobacteria bacterium]
MKLQIKVIPSSSKDCIAGWLEDTLKVKVKAPAEKGKANKAVIKTLEKTLELAKGSITISSGTTSTRKIIEINNVDENSINKRLSAICSGQD